MTDIYKNQQTLPSTKVIDRPSNFCVSVASSSSAIGWLAVSCSSVYFLLAPVWPPLCPLFPPKKRTYNSITDPFYVSFESKLMDFKYLLDFKYLDYLDYLLDFKYFGLEKKIACSIFTDVRLKWPFLNIYLFILFVFCFIQQNVKLKPPKTE